MSTVVKSETWFYCEGSSDKVYSIQITEVPGGYNVDGWSGRRGATLLQQAKTKTGAVTLAEAEKIFASEQVVRRKKGYTLDISGAPYSGATSVEQKTTMVPQLLNDLDPEDLDLYLGNDDWMMQEKKDGTRLMIQVEAGKVIGGNRRCIQVGMPSEIEKSIAKSLSIGGEVDGELVGETYYLFDLLNLGPDSLRSLPYYDRWVALTSNIALEPGLELVRTALGETDKRELFNTLQEERAEGVVFKLRSAKWYGGRPNSGGSQVKYKFWASATCRVLAVHPTKSSINVGVLSSNPPTLESIGNCTVPSNYETPKVGDLVEIKYLYFYPGGSLYQPQYRGLRTDKTEPDCIGQLKKKGTFNDEE